MPCSPTTLGYISKAFKKKKRYPTISWEEVTPIFKTVTTVYNIFFLKLTFECAVVYNEV